MAIKPSKKKRIIVKGQGVAVPIKWNIPDNIITRFASNIVVQTLENEFKISFFEIYPDIESGLEHRVPNEVQADCVASVVVSAEKLPIFISVLQTQYNTFKSKKSILPVVSREP